MELLTRHTISVTLKDCPIESSKLEKQIRTIILQCIRQGFLPSRCKLVSTSVTFNGDNKLKPK